MDSIVCMSTLYLVTQLVLDFPQLVDYMSAMECYSEALQLYPRSCDGSCDHERAVCFANRAACHMKKASSDLVKGHQHYMLPFLAGVSSRCD
jgi:hypothetical protein